MGWTFKPTTVPTDNLEEDWHTLVKLECKKKTHFECVFPFLYVYPIFLQCKYFMLLCLYNKYLILFLM